MATPVENFGLVTVSALYGAGDTSIALTAGHGSRLPATTGGYTYPLTWWNATDYAHPADDPNREIVLVTSRAADTLTVTRAQEGTSASTKNTASKTYRMSLGLTKALWEASRTVRSSHQGLQLQTHRDSDVAHKQVELVDVESIVMDDGTELRNDNDEWSGKLADITVSGAGGLDSGTELVSTWYEIFAIAKEDGTRNLLLHQSKTWAISTNHTTGGDLNQKLRGSASTNKLAQGFQVADSGNCPYVEVKINRVGTPTGKVWFTIETNNAGSPSGTVIATTHAYDVARLPEAPDPITDANWVRFPIKSSTTLSVSTQYHLVMQGDYTVDTNNCVTWQVDSTASGYTAGTFKLYDSGTTLWSDFDYDALFAVAIEFDVNAIAMPTGYTKQCFLGWVWNDGDGNFESFLQVGRSRRNTVISEANDVAWTTNGLAEMVDLLSFLPPRHIIKAFMSFTGSGTSAGVLAVGDLRATDISSAGTTTGAQLTIYAGTTITRPTEFQYVFVQTLGIMVMGTDGGKIWVTGFEW